MEILSQEIKSILGFIFCCVCVYGLFHLQVDRSVKPYNNLQLYEMLVELMKDEENIELQIRDSEKEVLQITITTTNVFV